MVLRHGENPRVDKCHLQLGIGVMLVKFHHSNLKQTVPIPFLPHLVVGVLQGLGQCKIRLDLHSRAEVLLVHPPVGVNKDQINNLLQGDGMTRAVKTKPLYLQMDGIQHLLPKSPCQETGVILKSRHPLLLVGVVLHQGLLSLILVVGIIRWDSLPKEGSNLVIGTNQWTK